MMKMQLLKEWPKEWRWAGLIGGFIFWYLAHDLGFYYSAYNCNHRGIIPTIHVITLIGSVYSGLLSYRSWSHSNGDTAQSKTTFISGISVAAASLFTLVIFWQMIAAFIFTGCER